jgi:hypothetical protein
MVYAVMLREGLKEPSGTHHALLNLGIFLAGPTFPQPLLFSFIFFALHTSPYMFTHLHNTPTFPLKMG